MAARILVVDDEPDLEALVVQRFRRRIRNGEFEFVFARDGEQALQILGNSDDMAMVLSDINMPRMDGLTLLARLNESHGDLRVVIVSAYGDMRNIRTAMNRGAFDFLTKPIEFDDLEVTIDKTLDDMSRSRALRRAKLKAEEAKHAMSRYFSPSIVRQMEEDPTSLRVGGERRLVTLLFTDLADFTPLAESTTPDILIPLLNEYLDGITQIIFDHDGTVIKTIGDAVRAMFGAPLEQSNQAEQAVLCALACDAFALDFQEAKRAEGIMLGVTRIGINSGHAIVGNFGGEHFFEYGAYGDVINVAARLEAANKYFGTRLCVGAATATSIDGFRGRPIGNLVLKGKTEALEAFEPLAAEHFDVPSTRAYLDAYEKMRDADPAASKAFAAYVGEFGEDPLATFHLRRLLAGENGTRIELPQT